MNTEFNVGDLVVIHKPDKDEYPHWISGMNEFDGKEMIVSSTAYINSESATVITLKRCPYNFNARWLERVNCETFNFETNIKELF